jgi:hypothetical protein
MIAFLSGVCVALFFLALVGWARAAWWKRRAIRWSESRNHWVLESQHLARSRDYWLCETSRLQAKYEGPP